MNANNHDKYYEKETPVYVKVAGGEIRFYKQAQRLAVSKNMWLDADGVEHIGKTVTIPLEYNKGNGAFIELLEEVLAVLKETPQEGGADNGRS